MIIFCLNLCWVLGMWMWTHFLPPSMQWFWRPQALCCKVSIHLSAYAIFHVTLSEISKALTLPIFNHLDFSQLHLSSSMLYIFIINLLWECNSIMMEANNFASEFLPSLIEILCE